MKSMGDLDALSTVLASSDYFLVHNDTGDFKVPYTDIMPADHNSIFRGKNLGTVTADNIDDFITAHGISTGTFTDIFPGDYFTITYPVPTFTTTTDEETQETTVTASYSNASKVIRVLGCNVFKYTGDTSLTSNHIVCAPETYLFSAPMNSTNTTGVSANAANDSGLGAYAGSDMHNLYIPFVNSALTDIFGSHLLTHRELLANAISTTQTSRGNTGWTGASTARTWYDVQAVLMSEVEVYGSVCWGSSGFDTGIFRQMPMYALNPMMINNGRNWFWLRDVASSSMFCLCYSNGLATSGTASGSYSVRPRFLLG